MVDLKLRIEQATNLEAIVQRLEAGESPALLADSLGLGAVALVASLARVGLGDEASEGPTLTQVAPKHPKLAKALTESTLAPLFPGSTRPSRLALAAGLLQILDFWDASHNAAQEADDLGEASTAAYWHGIAHRREPDPGNAQYWARRVGRHPIHPALADAARAISEASSDRAANPGNAWSPTTLIDLATRAKPGTPQAKMAQKLQRIEMICLLETSLGRVLS
jgi:hypothetical protein